ncbi:hypothetical protein Tco_0605415 [Tanacetum coccineum]
MKILTPSLYDGDAVSTLCDEVWSPSEHPKKKHNEETSTNLAWTEPGKHSGEAGMSKDTPGPESLGELWRSWYVKGHVRSRVVSPVLGQGIKGQPNKGTVLAEGHFP